MEGLRGADAAVHSELVRRSGARTFLDLSLETGYSMPAVVTSVARLERRHYIRVSRLGPGRPNVYTLIPETRRRAVLMARTMGLVS